MKIPETIEEEKAVIDAAKRDHRYFDALYRKYFKQIFLFVLKRTGNESLTGELCSEVFIKAMIKIKGYQHKGYPFSSWLYRIAINEINMHYRRSNRNQTVEIKEKDAIDLMTVFDEENEHEIKLAALLSGMEALSEKHQRLIELRFFDKQSFAEIGGILNISPGNAKIRTYRALEKLRAIVSKRM